MGTTVVELCRPPVQISLYSIVYVKDIMEVVIFLGALGCNFLV